MWESDSNYSSASCIHKPCQNLTNSCNCSADTRCFWMNPTLGCLGRMQVGCTPLDVVIVYGIAGGIYQTVGRSDNGWLTLNALLKTWFWRAALTRTPSGVNPGTVPGMRIMISEFQQGAAVFSNSTTGTKGTLSGDTKELIADIDWHIGMYQRPNSSYAPIMAPALDKARSVLNTTYIAGRQQIVLIITDG
jgi:hypothetical protein